MTYTVRRQIQLFLRHILHTVFRRRDMAAVWRSEQDHFDQATVRVILQIKHRKDAICLKKEL